jgi:CHAD domain-containing protein
MTAVDVLLDAVNTRWKKYSSELKKCRSEFSSEAVHDLRVAVRRLLAVFDLLRSVIHHPRIQKIRRALKEQLDDLDELRDVQVHLADISEFIHDVPPLNIFREFLQKREKKLLHAARNKIEAIKLGGLSDRIEKVRGMVNELSEQSLVESLYESLDDAFARAARRYAAIDVEKPATIHRLRVAFKKFRYMVEIIHPLLGNFPSENFQKMHDYQGMMGDIQDMEVALQLAGDLADARPSADLKIVQAHYTERFKRSLFNYLEDKGELLTFWRIAPDQSFLWEN